MNEITNKKSIKNNKRHLRAEGFLLLPSALRPRLLDLILFALVLLSFTTIGCAGSNVFATSLTLTIPQQYQLDVTPTVDGNFTESIGKIGVRTDDNLGYTLTIKAKSDEKALLNGDNRLESINERITKDIFDQDNKYNNMWGFSPSKLGGEDNTNYLPAPTKEEMIIEETLTANSVDNQYNISLGARANNNLPAGSYTNSFIISVTSNTSSIDGEMQNWMGCNDLALGNTVTLLDTRDNNRYTVTKLEDNKCWMSQNLRIIDETISSADSDMTDGTFIIPKSTNSGFNFNTVDDQPRASISSYDGHLNGYYNWYTATAGEGTESFKGETSRSICPKGWKLPNLNEVTTLYSQYRQSAPSNFNLYSAGYCDHKGCPREQDKYGVWWTSSDDDVVESWADTMIIDDYYSQPTLFSSSQDGKGVGDSVRCVARENGKKYSITYVLYDRYNATWDEVNPQTGVTTEDKVKIYSTKPSALYQFVAWCDQDTTYYNYNFNCSGKQYKPGDEIELPEQENNITLYAQYSAGCFTADTLIDTLDGLMPIKDVVPGTKIYAYDFANSEVKEDIVTRNFQVNRDDVVDLTFKDGTNIQGTYGHQFYNAALDTWTKMGDLNFGDTLRTIGGINSSIQSIKKLQGNADVYNLMTDSYHNYFVATEENGNRYIVKAVNRGDADSEDYLLYQYGVSPLRGPTS